jgi:hypothetical protein
MISITLFFVAIIAVWIASSLIPNNKLPEERDLTPQYQTRCAGIRRSSLGLIGATGSALPFWRLSIYESFIVIAAWLPVAIRYQDIDSLSDRNYVFFRSIRFRSKKHGIDFSAWIFSPDPLIKSLQEHGVR